MMNGGWGEVLVAALSLSAEERARLVTEILRSMPERDADAAWDAEILDRIASYDRGECLGIPAHEAFAVVAGRPGK